MNRSYRSRLNELPDGTPRSFLEDLGEAMRSLKPTVATSVGIWLGFVLLGCGEPKIAASRDTVYLPSPETPRVASPSQAPTSGVTVTSTAIPANREWNFDDSNAETNGNMELAAALLSEGADVAGAPVEDVEPIMRSPWKWYGKAVCFVNTVHLVQDERVEEGVVLGDVVTVSDDEHIVEYMLLGGSGDVRVGQRIKLCGFPVGRMEVENKLGGKFTHLIVIGKQ